MSKQQIQQQARQITRAQLFSVAGTLLASGAIDLATHNIVVGIIGGCAVGVAGLISRPDVLPEILRLLFPGSNPDQTVKAVAQIVEQLAPYEDLPQDFNSKMKRLLNLKSAEKPGRPKDEPVSNLPRQQKPETSAKDKQAPSPIAIPPQFKLDSVLGSVQAANEGWHIYFGQNGSGKAITVLIDDMYHVLDVSSSGKGKSNRFRLAMMQLVDTCEVYYINPFAAKVKSVKDSRRVEVWAPIFERLANGKPMKTEDEINQITTSLVNLIQERNRREEDGDFGWQDQPVFVFVDELPETFARCPEAVDRLDRIGRTGRQFGVFTYVASQTAQVKEIGQSTAAQANYKTRIYGGGDATSATRMMKQAVSSEHERALQSNGAGLTLMLADGMDGLEYVRAPLVTNEAIFEYFGLTFNLDDWLPARGTSTLRRGHALHLVADTDAEKPLTQLAQPEQELPTTLDAIMRLYQADKIDSAMFQKLVDALSGPIVDTEPLQVKPVVDEELERAIKAFLEDGATSINKMAAALDIKPNQAGPLLMKAKKEVERRQSEND